MRPFIRVVLLSVLSLSSFAKEEKKEFIVNDPGKRDTVRFVLDAPLEVINGNTNSVKGKFTFEKAKFNGTFTVPVTSLKTGIADRDGHLQNSKWLDAQKNPNIELTFKDVKVADTVWKGTEFSTDAEAEVKLHGTTKTEKVKLILQYFPADKTTAERLPGNLLRAKSEFQITLSDYGIAQSDSKVKSLIGLKVGKSVAITADVMASDKLTL